jgi:serine/threonine protein kinase
VLCVMCGTDGDDAVRCSVCGFTLPSSAVTTEDPVGDALGVGTVVHRRYQILSILGRGGFGITYKARDTSTHKIVALKELFPPAATRTDSGALTARQTADMSGAIDRFLQEAESLHRFHHPHIVGIIESFQANETAYVAMEYLAGQTLAQRLMEGVLTVTEVRALVNGLATALEMVHGAGMIHRDIKPANIVLVGGRGPVLIDFGSARSQIADSAQNHTQIVTPGYGAPEQYASRGMLSPAADVYALGSTLYECLTGKCPPSAIDRIQGLAHLDPPPNHVPDHVQRVLWRSLEILQQDRPTIAEFRHAINLPPPTPVAIVAPIPVLSAPGLVPTHAAMVQRSQPKSASPWILTLVIAGVLAVVLILVLAGINAGQTSAAPTIQPVSVPTPKPVVRPSTVKKVPANTEASTKPSTTFGGSDLAEIPSDIDENLGNDFSNIVTNVADRSGLTVTAEGLNEAEASGPEEIVIPLGAVYGPLIRRRAVYFADQISDPEWSPSVSGADFYGTKSEDQGIVVGVVVRNNSSYPTCNITFDLTMYDASTPNKVAVMKDHHVYIPRSKFIVPAGQSGFVAIDIPRKYLKSYPVNKTYDLRSEFTTGTFHTDC